MYRPGRVRVGVNKMKTFGPPSPFVASRRGGGEILGRICVINYRQINISYLKGDDLSEMTFLGPYAGELQQALASVPIFFVQRIAQ